MKKHVFNLIPLFLIMIVYYSYSFYRLGENGTIVGPAYYSVKNSPICNGLGIIETKELINVSGRLKQINPSLLFTLLAGIVLYILNNLPQNRAFNQKGINCIIFICCIAFLLFMILSIFYSAIFDSLIGLTYFYFLISLLFSLFVLTLSINIGLYSVSLKNILFQYILSFIFAYSLLTELGNYYMFNYSEQYNLGTDLNNAVLVGHTFTNHLMLPGYFVWRGFNIYLLISSFLLLNFTDYEIL